MTITIDLEFLNNVHFGWFVGIGILIYYFIASQIIRIIYPYLDKDGKSGPGRFIFWVFSPVFILIWFGWIVLYIFSSGLLPNPFKLKHFFGEENET